MRIILWGRSGDAYIGHPFAAMTSQDWPPEKSNEGSCEDQIATPAPIATPAIYADKSIFKNTSSTITNDSDTPVDVCIADPYDSPYLNSQHSVDSAVTDQDRTSEDGSDYESVMQEPQHSLGIFLKYVLDNHGNKSYEFHAQLVLLGHDGEGRGRTCRYWARLREPTPKNQTQNLRIVNQMLHTIDKGEFPELTWTAPDREETLLQLRFLKSVLFVARGSFVYEAYTNWRRAQGHPLPNHHMAPKRPWSGGKIKLLGTKKAKQSDEHLKATQDYNVFGEDPDEEGTITADGLSAEQQDLVESRDRLENEAQITATPPRFLGGRPRPGALHAEQRPRDHAHPLERESRPGDGKGDPADQD